MPIDLSHITTFRAENGAELHQLSDGSVFTSIDEAQAYQREHGVEMLVGQFMAHVEEHPSAFFGSEGKEMPADRALLALKTRLRNNAEKVLNWFLTQQAAV